jgi:hypothetical protein
VFPDDAFEDDLDDRMIGNATIILWLTSATASVQTCFQTLPDMD